MRRCPPNASSEMKTRLGLSGYESASHWERKRLFSASRAKLRLPLAPFVLLLFPFSFLTLEEGVFLLDLGAAHLPSLSVTFCSGLFYARLLTVLADL